MRFGSRGAAAHDAEPVVPEDEARIFTLACERLRRDAEIWWPHEAFFTSSQDAAGQSACPALIDATGRARLLISGPFTRLPAGLWRASLVLRLSAPVARRPLTVDFGAEPEFSAFNLPYGVPGLHRVDLETTFGGDEEVQVRLWLKRAAFDGDIGFLGVALRSVEASRLSPAIPSGAAC